MIPIEKQKVETKDFPIFIETIGHVESITSVEIRTRESQDIKPYLQKLEFEKIEIDFPPEFEEIKYLLKEIHDDKISELKNRTPLSTYPSKTMLLKLQAKLIEELRHSRDFNKMFAYSASAQALKISHALELLETQTITS